MLAFAATLALTLSVLPTPSFAAPVPLTPRSGDILSGLDVLNDLGVVDSLLKRSGSILSDLDIANSVLAHGNDLNDDDAYYGSILESVLRRRDLLDAAGSGQGAGVLGVGNGLLGLAGKGEGAGVLQVLDSHPNHGHGYPYYPSTHSSSGLTKIALRSPSPSLGNGLLSAAGSGSSSGAGLLSLGNSPLLGLAGSSSGSGVLSLGSGNGEGLLGIGGHDGLLGTGLLAGSDGRKHWKAPVGWTRPTWYEFGYWHPETACWVSDAPTVLAYLTTRGYISTGATPSYPLFPSGLVHPSRSVDWSHKGKYGYFTDAGLFIDLDLDVNALLGSCGYYNPSYHF